MNYIEKYLKYKSKYLNLTNKLIGGQAKKYLYIIGNYIVNQKMLYVYITSDDETKKLNTFFNGRNIQLQSQKFYKTNDTSNIHYMIKLSNNDFIKFTESFKKIIDIIKEILNNKKAEAKAKAEAEAEAEAEADSPAKKQQSIPANQEEYTDEKCFAIVILLLIIFNENKNSTHLKQQLIIDIQNSLNNNEFTIELQPFNNEIELELQSQFQTLKNYSPIHFNLIKVKDKLKNIQKVCISNSNIDTMIEEAIKSHEEKQQLEKEEN